MKTEPIFLTDAQLRCEIDKCEFCQEKPCKTACPADCSPADFIMAAKMGGDADYERAAAIILGSNPFGGICGQVCPDYHCMKACVHRTFDHPVEIPLVQSAIIERARMRDHRPTFNTAADNGKKIAIIGAGPAGIGAAGVLAQRGYNVTIFERDNKAGGMCHLIPEHRLDRNTLNEDLKFASSLGKIEFQYNQTITDAAALKKKGFAAVIVATGLDHPFKLGITGEEYSLDWKTYLEQSDKYDVSGKSVVVIGGGAIATDCAVTAVQRGAASAKMIALEKFNEMPLTSVEWKWIRDHGVEIIGRTRAIEIASDNNGHLELSTQRVTLPSGETFHPRVMQPVANDVVLIHEATLVIIAIGARAGFNKVTADGVYYAGDMINGPTTVVEAVAAGKNCAELVDTNLTNREAITSPIAVKSTIQLQGKNLLPVSLETDFFGRKINSPFILSAAPPTDGYHEMVKAYRAGWAGGVMKTSFDDVDIHIPGSYMFVLNELTYGNCDNVSGHPLDRVCREVAKLVAEFPDRLTIASTGGPVSGDDVADAKVWQSNTKKLEAAGAMGIEYSLSCPQGGDGTKGDIVSQDAELTAKIIDWIMQVSDPEIPKLFKLTGAVTAIQPIMRAIKEVLDRYPHKKAGVTLANSFPALQFRPNTDGKWDTGYVVGMSGEGVAGISYLTLANAANVGVTISGNGGPMDYKAAANFLALGVKTVQFCTVAMKYGVEIIDELNSGLSYLMKERGFKSVNDLIGCALPNPILGFMEIPATKLISSVNANLCEHCGNCERCPYLAISLNSEKVPVTDPAKCIGCLLCAQKCFAGALTMRKRTPEETAMLVEA